MYRIILFLLLISSFVNGQNLISNPSFEKHGEIPCERIPVGTRWMFTVDDWICPLPSSTDVFSTEISRNCWNCAVSQYTSVSTAGQIHPRIGETYIGLLNYGIHDGHEYHEYLSTKLKRPLRPGNTYYVEFWVARPCIVPTASNNLGAYFSEDLIYRNEGFTLVYDPQINSEEIIESTDWTKLSGTFIATDSSRYMTIGNFYPDSKTRTKRVSSCKKKKLLRKEPYYYIDDVLVKCIDCIPPDTSESIVYDKVELSLDQNIILENIFFEFDKTVLLDKSQTELNKLFDLMEQYPDMEIEISGHTDDQGTNEYNEKLSDGRAHAVVDYLISKGIPAKRLSWHGYGEARPVSDDPQRNRRVEFKILKF